MESVIFKKVNFVFALSEICIVRETDATESILPRKIYIKNSTRTKICKWRFNL